MLGRHPFSLYIIILMRFKCIGGSDNRLRSGGAFQRALVRRKLNIKYIKFYNMYMFIVLYIYIYRCIYIELCRWRSLCRREMWVAVKRAAVRGRASVDPCCGYGGVARRRADPSHTHTEQK